MVNVHELKHLTVLDDQASESSLNTMLERKAIKDHLKTLKQIKKDLKRHPTGTPLRKRDRIDVKEDTKRKGK